MMKKGKGAHLLPCDLYIILLLITSFRLHLQHHVIKRSFEDRLILAPVRLDAGSVVLECGTGSGQYMISP